MTRRCVPRWGLRWLLGLGILAWLVACGGGVETGGTGSYGYAQGAITGYGSIVVNGVHYDETQAVILGDDGRTRLAGTDLLLGMTVEVTSSAVDTATLTAVATKVQLRSELLGPVATIDAGAGTLTVLGQTVKISASTVFDQGITGGLSGLSKGALVEVYAIVDPVSGVYLARRINPVSTATYYKIRGTVGTVGSQQFTIGAATFAYSGLPVLHVGEPVRLLLQKTLDGAGRYQIARSSDDTPRVSDHTEVEIEGVISSFQGLSSFVVGGLKVDASSATVSGSGLADGVPVEVEGTIVAGVLKAREVEVRSAEGGDEDDGSGSGGAVEYEIEGHIVGGTLDTVAKTFQIGTRAQLVDYSGASFSNGTESRLTGWTGKLHVKGVLAADGKTVTARRIEFDT